jgi:hypothetical protein
MSRFPLWERCTTILTPIRVVGGTTSSTAGVAHLGLAALNASS